MTGIAPLKGNVFTEYGLWIGLEVLKSKEYKDYWRQYGGFIGPRHNGIPKTTHRTTNDTTREYVKSSQRGDWWVPNSRQECTDDERDIYYGD